MATKLFLLEFHVGNIYFEPSFKKPVPSKDDVVMDIQFGDVYISIDPEMLPLDKNEGKDRTITYNMGKSYLFTSQPKDLIQRLKNNNLEMHLKIDCRIVGTAVIPWTENFCEMIKLYEQIGVVKAVDRSDTEEVKDKHGEVISKMDVFLRLSCYGDFIETQYKANTVGQRREYVFKNPCDKNTFKCELLQGSRILPVMNLYNPVTKVDNVLDEERRVSWTEIFGVGMDQTSRLSYSPFAGGPEMGMIPLTEILQHSSLETISICFRPEENKFYDLLNLITTEVSTTHDTTTLTITKERPRPLDICSPRRKSRDEATEMHVSEDPLELTADKINRRLCKNRDCPAAKKFKEYGIGPLATGKGLGTVYGDVESDVQYGISNTYGTMSNYGPFGIYTRPKRPDQPFIPPRNTLETKTPPEPNNMCSHCFLRLRGGGPWPDQPTVVLENSSKIQHRESGSCIKRRDATTQVGRSRSNDVPRLRGGGPQLNASVFTSFRQRSCDTLRLKGGGPLAEENTGQGLKSPIKECKAVMDKFDEILVAYKRTLGVCGHASCPLAPIMVEEKCKRVCGKEGTVPVPDTGGVLCDKPCEFSSGYAAAACREPKCAYAKYKLGLVDDDAALELQFLPPAVSGKCGHPKCPYPIQADLPPIHWDCPDPLPKGKCKNLNCPLQPPDLRKLKCPPPKPGPCGSPDCPYALPSPCGLPTCPFRPQPCPFMEKEKQKQKAEDEDICDNPECPFANKDVGPSESFVGDDVAGHFMGCSNPQCPFTTKGTRRPKPKSNNINVCGNPSCPFAKVEKQIICDNPNCIFVKERNGSVQQSNNNCGNPKCPFVKMQKDSVKQSNNMCDNPRCPFVKMQKNTCDGRRCPFVKEPNGSVKQSNNMCDNPKCPFVKMQKDKICGQDCPPINSDGGSTNKNQKNICDGPRCPFGKGGAVGKDCPLINCGPAGKNKKQKGICDDPRCPLGKGGAVKDICDNPKCPFGNGGAVGKDCPLINCGPGGKNKKQKGICDDPRCPLGKGGAVKEICDNPKCPFGNGGTVKDICDNPKCPFGNGGAVKDICDNPKCPSLETRRDMICEHGCSFIDYGVGNKDKNQDICDNPECPFMNGGAGDTNNTEICDNPECPFSEEKCSKASADCNIDESICENPECPYAGAKEEPLICDNPQCPFRQTLPSSAKDAEVSDKKGGPSSGKKRKKRSKFVYTIGNQYPGVKVGHKECVSPILKVPPKMGWLWNIPMENMMKNIKPRRGWKPGAIQRNIAAMIRAHRQAKGLGILKLPKFKRNRDGCLVDDDAEEQLVSPKPTLQIQKKDGAYWITMNPLKDPKTLVDNENPYMECTPMQFKITKNKKPKDEAGDESKLCYCDEDEPSSSSSDSELDIEFTPPAGIIHPERFKKKKNIVHCEAQYDPKDFSTEKPEKKEKKGKKGGKDKKGGKKGKKGKK